MGFLQSLTRAIGLTLGLHWESGSDFLQLPITKPPSTHHVIEPLEHDYSAAAAGLKFCNYPTNRGCWLEGGGPGKDFVVTTDYEQRWPQGVTREYWLNVTYTRMAPDGQERIGKLINGTFPGPLIEANWGDKLVIHVTNYLSAPGYLEDNGTTIHWHGIRQWLTSEADGVNGVTQCPIKPGNSYTYEWTATQYGHSWYHSHYSLQYPDGVWGPLLIHGPTSANWDIDVGVITISDYFHENAFVLFSTGELGDDRDKLAAKATMLNGKAIFPCNGSEAHPGNYCSGRSGSRYETVFEKGKKFLLRIVNTSTATQFRFAIDNHMLQVVQADFVPIEPYLTEYISVGIGQRYTIVVTANPNSTDPFPVAPSNNNFWIRTIPLDGCSHMASGIFPTYGILRYNSASTSDPTSKPWSGGIPPECLDEPAGNMHPIVPWTIGSRPADTQSLDVGLIQELDHGNFTRWEIGGEPMWLDWGNPTIINLENRTWNPEYDVIVEDHASWQWVYFIIQGQLPTPLVAHPIHLHGHDFAILAQGKGDWDQIYPRPPLNLNNPVRRDVALLDSGGYLIIAFRTDNPGIWLMHCHIAWHASSGLALQLLERQGEIAKTIKNRKQIDETCNAWKDYRTHVSIFQDDSGI